MEIIQQLEIRKYCKNGKKITIFHKLLNGLISIKVLGKNIAVIEKLNHQLQNKKNYLKNQV